MSTVINDKSRRKRFESPTYIDNTENTASIDVAVILLNGTQFVLSSEDDGGDDTGTQVTTLKH